MHQSLLILIAAVTLSACATIIGNGPAPVYGCWCGKNQPAPNEDPRPVDVWDEACRRHDLCYRRYGSDNRDCDVEFVIRLEEIALHLGEIPGQMQVAHSYFGSRLRGVTYVQGWFSGRDIEALYDAGRPYLCKE